MSKRAFSALIVLCFIFTLPFIYGGCSSNGGGGGTGCGDANDICGNVTTNGSSEAGVWVIAETFDVSTNDGAAGRFIKIVVTDQNGDYVLPDLPDGTYDVWVRGYGLVDSDAVQAVPGDEVDLMGVLAATPQEAAAIFPANYWASIIELPDEDEFPGTGAEGNGWAESLLTRDQLIDRTKLGCQLCHQLGTPDTRLPSAAAFDFGWKKAGTMNGTANGIGRENLAEMLGDWGARIASGEVPPTPPRPFGKERNFVLTMWEWGDLFTYAHDEVATDKRNPFLYPNEPVWGVDIGNDYLLKLDPNTHAATRIPVPTRNGWDTAWCFTGFQTLGCPAEGGTTAYPNAYHNPANPHNPMLDDTGKVWITTQIRPEGIENLPDFCLERDPGLFGGHRQMGYYDTNTEEFVLIDTCFGTHHLQFDFDGDLWMSGDFFNLGVIYPDMLDPDDPEGTEGDAQEWWRMVVDSDGDGEADTPAPGFNYGIIPNFVDGTIWAAQLGAGPQGKIMRFDPSTEKFEVYTPPLPGYGPRGLDSDTEGNIWTCLGGSSHLAKFERSKCAQTYGTGDQCPEGWTLYEIPGATYKGIPDRRTDYHYYTWVDQFNILGLGENTVVCTGTASDSIISFLPETEEFVRTYVPYPYGFFHRGQDGRIDDPSSWKGKAWWVDYGIDPILHTELEQGFVFKVQYRPNPLAH